MKKFKFKVQIEGSEAGVVAAIAPPFDVVEVFGTRARVPVRGTINGFPFRSSLMPCGGRHRMPVRKTLRTGAGVRPGDTVSVVLERDQAERSVAVPPVLKKELRNRKIARASWEKLSFTHKKEIALALTGESRNKRAPAVWPKSWMSSAEGKSGPANRAAGEPLPRSYFPETGGSRRCPQLRHPRKPKHSPG
jgi:hypothetical protein